MDEKEFNLKVKLEGMKMVLGHRLKAFEIKRGEKPIVVLEFCHGFVIRFEPPFELDLEIERKK